ncbi:DNA repair protein REV1 [Protopterus annectens]|uniref:DNA repair protein REV1 n=1 Tax=Protopterus annectens TaxID=7888 RepID=UPI001CF9E495|nr:DNA repair protein REV1 [Protopterus annectens]
MSRAGWRKRANEVDGWGGWGGYMSAKVQKLEEQFRQDAPKQHQNDRTLSIFKGVAIYVNGYTDPTADELRRLMLLHGGQYHVYYCKAKTTHIIATNLPNAKVKELKEEKVVRPEWITDSIKVGYLLPYIPYQLYTKLPSTQKGFIFRSLCKPEESVAGPSNITTQSVMNLNVAGSKEVNTGCELRASGLNSCHEEKEGDNDKDFEAVKSEQVFPICKNMLCYEDNIAHFNKQIHNSNVALEKQEHLKETGDMDVFSQDNLLEEDEQASNRCCSGQQHCYKKSDNFICNSDQTASNPPFLLHNKNKIISASISSYQSPLSTKSTSEHSPSKMVSLPRPMDRGFISQFYSYSRLHHISTWKSEFTRFVNTLKKQSSGAFPGREKLKRIIGGRMYSPTSIYKTGQKDVTVLPKHQKCIMHVDIDCFFVSVSVLDSPDLKGKPVAVTSNKGSGKGSMHSGASADLEMQYYENLSKGKKGEKTDNGNQDSHTWDSLNHAEMNAGGVDVSPLSMAEIASCSYEARKAGVKNGMFFGQAKQMCPDLLAVPYNFQAYKEVAQTMYETLASYTHDIEAVSCDEAFLDITEILLETGLTPEEVADVIRNDIKEKTKCSASAGISSNILLARMATRKAKPEGQYYLKPEHVDDFIRGQPVAYLPGVGKSMECKLAALSVKTCGDLQHISLAKLQKEFGPKIGQKWYRFCRGLDDRPVQTEKERKSVSAEINYGIRFTQTKEAEAFLLNLSEELQQRLEAAGVKGKRLTLKIMVRKAGAPLEPAKFGGHGICDNIARTVTLEHATDSARIISSEIINLFYTMKLNIADVRGVGIQMHHLVPVCKNALRTSGHSPVYSKAVMTGCHSVHDLIKAQNLKTTLEGNLQEGCPKGNFSPEISTSAFAMKQNVFRTPVSLAKLHVSIEVPSPSQIDPEIFAALPADLQEEVRAALDQRQWQRESIAVQPTVSKAVSRNPLLQLKPPLMKHKKKKRNQGSPVKKIISPMKTKLLGTPSRNSGIDASHSLKLVSSVLKQVSPAAEVQLQGDPDSSLADHSQVLVSQSVSHQIPNLAGAVEFSDVKALLKEWITTISDPMEEDILQVVKYCTGLIEERDLEKLDLVVKYMKRMSRLMLKFRTLDIENGYLRECIAGGIVPKGLRVWKYPNNVQIGSTFHKELLDVFNNCGLEILKTIIKENNRVKDEIQNEIEELDQCIKDDLMFTIMEEKEKYFNVRLEIDKKCEQMVQRKLKKFERDSKEYRSNTCCPKPRSYRQKKAVYLDKQPLNNDGGYHERENDNMNDDAGDLEDLGECPPLREFYQQVQGVVLGTACAPTYANLVLAKWEE